MTSSTSVAGSAVAKPAAAIGSTPAIELRHATKRYGDAVALDDVSMTIAAREFLRHRPASVAMWQVRPTVRPP